MTCTNSTCDAHATQILAWKMTGDAVYVAPYCDDHGAEVRSEQGAVFACGPALSDDARMIEGWR